MNGARRWTARRMASVTLLAVLGTACSDYAEPAFRIPGADIGRGRALIEAHGCGACHTIPGVRGAEGKVGPPLTDFAQRAYIAGRLANTPDALVRWLLNPQGVDPLTAMPRVGLTEREARDVAGYLYTLGDAQPLGPPHPLPQQWLEHR